MIQVVVQCDALHNYLLSVDRRLNANTNDFC